MLHLVGEVFLSDFGFQIVYLVKFRLNTKKISEFSLPVFLLWSILIPQDAEMSNCEELICSQCLGTSLQTVLHSQFWTVQFYSAPGVYAVTLSTGHKWHMRSVQSMKVSHLDWIRLQSEKKWGGRKKREEVREWKRVGSKSISLWGKYATSLSKRGGVRVRLSDVCTIQRHRENIICFDSQSLPSSIVRFTPPFTPPIKVIDFYGNKASTSHKITLLWWGLQAYVFSPPTPLPPLGVLKERGGEGCWSLEVELTSRLGMMDVSIRDMETWSVTDISII